MSLHADVFFVRKGDEMIKHVYMTSMHRCDQGTSAVISIADCVLKQFCKDEPNVKKLFAKSDNAGCYHGNYSAESMYHLCQKRNIQLLRYDFNEPCCGKDQCDRESAAAKSILRSFIDAGNDVMNAEDVYEGLHYGFGMKNTKVAVAKIEKVTLSGQKIKQKREDRQLCNLLFCLEYGCSESFTSQEQLDRHTLSGTHSYVNEKCNADKVKTSFVERMKSTVHSHSYSSLSVQTAENGSNEIYDRFFKEQGWALLVRHHFRYTAQQKKLLYKHLEMERWDGEKKGKKLSPDEVHLLLRKELSTKDYVTAQQIRSLFSNWCKMLRQGTLRPPCDADTFVIAEQYHLELNELACEATNKWIKDDWLVLVYENN